MEKKNIVTKEKIFILFILIFCILISVIFSIINIGNSNILKGISINGINVSGMSKAEAISLITSKIEKKVNNQITINIENQNQINYSFESLDISYNIQECVNEAFNIGRTGNIFENNFAILNLLINKKNIEITTNINEDKLNNIIAELSSNIENPMVQTSYYIEDNNLIITKGLEGNSIDKEKFIADVKKELKEIKKEENVVNLKIIQQKPENIDIDKIYEEIHTEVKNAFYIKEPLKVYTEVIGKTFNKNEAIQILQVEQEEYIIPLELTYPEITVNDLDIDIFQNLIASYETKYNVSNTDRVTNLNLAASKIDETIIAPNEEFSYNKVVGARTISAGYKEAKIYSNGKVVDGIGGGICQISSTLYNAVVLSNLDVTERHQHQFLTSYVDPGRDATVSYGSKDLKFINNRSYPIKIKATVKHGVVTCAIYGIKEDTEYNVSFDIENVSVKSAPIKYEEDPSLGLGTEITKQSGASGAVVNVYKVLKLNDEYVSRTLLSHDNYSTLDKIIIRNSKAN